MPMTTALLPLAALLSGVPITAQQQAAPQSGDQEIVTISTDMYNRMTVPVHFAGQGPYRFLIDTGAQNTVLSTAVAQRLALAPKARAKLIGVAGTTMVDTVEVDQIDLGRRSYYSLIAPLLESRNIGADGILGIDSLQGQRVMMDFRKGVMAIDDAKFLGGNRGFEIVVTAKRRSGQLIMTEARIDGVHTDVVIDTGAETSIGNLALAKALQRRSRETTTLRSVTGQEVEAAVSFGRQLVIDSMRINNIQIAYTEAPAFAALGLSKRPALLLGMRELRTFDRVAIDFSTRKVLFDLPRDAF